MASADTLCRKLLRVKNCVVESCRRPGYDRPTKRPKVWCGLDYGGILEIAKATAEGNFAGMDLNVFFSRTLDYIKSHWEENYAFLAAQPHLTYIAKWKDAIKYHFKLRFPEKAAVPNSGLIMEVIASAVIGAYTYWMEHPEEVDTQKLADISVQMLSASEQII